MEEKIIKINIEDHIILQSNSLGNDILKLAFKAKDQVSGKEATIFVRFPTWGQWDIFTAKCAEFFSLLSQGADNLKLPTDIEELQEWVEDEQGFHQWCLLMQIALKPKMVKDIIADLFFNYICDRIEGIDINKLLIEKEKEYIMLNARAEKENSKLWNRIRKKKIDKIEYTQLQLKNLVMKEWAIDNLTIDVAFYLFLCIIQVDDFIKKKSRMILKKVYHQATDSQSNTSLANEQGTTPENLKTFQSSKLDSL